MRMSNFSIWVNFIWKSSEQLLTHYGNTSSETTLSPSSCDKRTVQKFEILLTTSKPDLQTRPSWTFRYNQWLVELTVSHMRLCLTRHMAGSTRTGWPSRGYQSSLPKRLKSKNILKNVFCALHILHFYFIFDPWWRLRTQTKNFINIGFSGWTLPKTSQAFEASKNYKLCSAPVKLYDVIRLLDNWFHH